MASLRFIIVPIILIPKTTQINAIAISIGHSNSAYSLEELYPNGNDMAAATLIASPEIKILKNH
jgi:hypothetical protein